MEKNGLITCPICNSKETNNILELDCGNFNNSTLYQFVKLNVCKKCGHVYNILSLDDINGLMKYYNNEYSQINLSSTDKIGDRPGSSNLFTLKRHTQLYSLISPYINASSKVLDVGCAMGGFLDYLYNQGLSNLYGIDLIEDYVSYAQKKGIYNIKLGNAESIPFEDNTFDLLILDQVIEHLIDPIKVFQEARRVLSQDGIICIGIPDASRYDEIYLFDFYWFIMREHVHHFDINHLKLVAELEGFKLESSSKNQTPMVSEKYILPNLNAIFRLTSEKCGLNISESCFKLENRVKNYIKNEFKRLNRKKKVIDDLIKSQKPLYFWGIGREFLYLYASTKLKNCNIAGLIDTNPYKRRTLTVGGMKIIDKSVLKKAASYSVLIISAIAHVEQIKATLTELGYSGQIIEV